MAQPNDLINAEASYIGIGGTDNIFNTWIWGQHVYNPDIYPWCAAFQSYCLNQVGIDFTPTASAAGVLNQFPRVGDDDVQPGDIVCFNWDGREDTGWMDHVGMIEWFDHSNGYFGTIEGNAGGGEGCVMRCTRYNYGSYFTAFSRPTFGATAPEPAPVDNGARSIQLYHSNGTDAQRWKIEHNDDGTFSFRSIACGKYLDVRDGLGVSGQPVRVFPCNKSDAQRFYMAEKSGDYAPDFDRPQEIIPKVNRDLRLDVCAGGDTDGTGIQIYEANGTHAQEWYVMDNGDGTLAFINNSFGQKLALDVVGGGK